ncbi:hypothetical protein PVK06_037907 [Gossypium arboreum]|uniref:Uncharacterized protein n=1 Tax=Gossypium arboreum TaxID=29729 RepID=A0ABR0MYN2_GOSAR|nr:hypothetical protein PVK06_037907 [Gossypium arboreum]
MSSITSQQALLPIATPLGDLGWHQQKRDSNATEICSKASYNSPSFIVKRVYIRKMRKSRDMMSALEGRVANLEGFIGDMKESLEIEELKGKLTNCKVVVEKWVLVVTPRRKMDVPKPKDQVGEGYGQFSLEKGIVIPCYGY